MKTPCLVRVQGIGHLYWFLKLILGYDNFEPILGYDKNIFSHQDYMEVSIMLATENKQESILKRIEQVVSVIMEQSPIYKEDFNYSEMVTHLAEVFEKALSFEEFKSISDESLKNRCNKMMSVQLLAKIGEDFTPEQMAIFDEAIKRK
jgi:hypothetical protein